MFWSGWHELARAAVVGSLAYFGIVLLLRAVGKQALTKLNAYGMIVTVTLGSVLATALLSQDVKLDKALLASRFSCCFNVCSPGSWLATASYAAS